MPGKNKLSKKKRKWTHGDWSLPGYKYLGPGNSLNKGPPTNNNDAVALRHDVAYRDIEDEGGDPYTMWSRADQQFLDDSDFNDYGGVLGKLYFGGKRLAHKAGFIDEWEPKRQRASDFPFDGNLATQSLLNSQQHAQDARLTNAIMADGDGSGNAAGLKETPVDRINQRVEYGPSEYTFAVLPFVRETTQSQTLWSQDIAFRMTSPYDPQIGNAGSIDLNAGTGSAIAINPVASDPDSTITSARWFEFYASMYNYYHVIRCHWHATIENMKTEPLWVHRLYYADEVPPNGATNEDMMCWKDCESHLLGPVANSIVGTGILNTQQLNTNQNNIEGAGTAGNNPNYTAGDMVAARGASPFLSLSGTYKPGQFNRQIRLDSEVENWTAVTTNPSLPERVLFRFRPQWNGLDTADASTYDRLMKYRINFRVNYIVEFKELKTGLRWPVERQPAFVTINTNIEEDEE